MNFRGRLHFCTGIGTSIANRSAGGANFCVQLGSPRHRACRRAANIHAIRHQAGVFRCRVFPALDQTVVIKSFFANIAAGAAELHTFFRLCIKHYRPPFFLFEIYPLLKTYNCRARMFHTFQTQKKSPDITGGFFGKLLDITRRFSRRGCRFSWVLAQARGHAGQRDLLHKTSR